MKTPTLSIFSAILISLALSCVGLSPQARAVCQEGCDIANGNTFLGDDALINVTFGAGNIAIGSQTLYNDTTGTNNIAVGWQALRDNTTGYNNTAIGVEAMLGNVDGVDNTAVGSGAMIYASASATGNTATGTAALQSCDGDNNTAMGNGSLQYNGGTQNTAMGNLALEHNGPGNNNTAVGYSALQASTGNNNIAVGAYAGSEVTGGNNIDIGNHGAPADTKTIRIGVAQTHRAAFIAGISGATVPGGVGVIIDASGHVGTVTSSARYKDNIQPMAKASEAVLSLKPVRFRYKKELDPKAIPQFGLVAEDVAKVDPDLVARDDEGKPYTVRYEAVNAMLLNEFLKAHKKIDEQASQLSDQTNEIAELKTALKALTARVDAKGL